MSVEQKTLKTPEENFEEAALELAIYRMLRQERDALMQNASEIDDEESTPRFLAFIEQQMKQHEQKKRIKHGTRILKTAIVAVLLMNMVLTIAAASNATVRAKVIGFLSEINDSYISIGFRESTLKIDVPAGWEESFYPTYIPDGYVLQSSFSIGGISETEYTDEDGNVLRIQICDITAFSKINTDDTIITHTTVHGIKAMVLQQPYDEVDVIWANGDRYFIISNNDYDTALAVAQSIKLIKT